MLDEKDVQNIRDRLEAAFRPGYSGVLTQGHVDAGKLLADRNELLAMIKTLEKSQTAVCIYCSARFNWDGGRGDHATIGGSSPASPRGESDET